MVVGLTDRSVASGAKMISGITFLAIICPILGDRITCSWWQYYDVNMKNCGPCSEICDHMVLTRTERSCREHCSEYLVSRKCSTDQYYDDVVHRCSPCTDLCSHRDVKGTADECFQRCSKYLEKNPPDPSNIEDHGESGSPGTSTDQTSDNSSSSNWSWIAFSAVSVLGIGVLAVVIRHRCKSRARNYTPAPNGQAETAIEMTELGPPVQVSTENVNGPSRTV